MYWLEPKKPPKLPYYLHASVCIFLHRNLAYCKSVLGWWFKPITKEWTSEYEIKSQVAKQMN